MGIKNNKEIFCKTLGINLKILPLTLFYIIKALNRLKWKREEFEKFQKKQIRKVIRHAFENQLFYHRLFKSAKIRPDDIKCVKDLNKIPIIDKSDMKKFALENLIANNFKINNLKKISTGGSMGHPFSIYINSKEDAWRKGIYLRANITCGQNVRDNWVAVIDPQYSNKQNKIHKELRFFFRKIIPVNLDRPVILKKLTDMNIDVLDGFPNALYLLAKDFQLNNLDPINPRIIFGSGELIDKNSIKYIEEIFSAPYFDQFGCSELDRTAWQCTQREGYHMDQDSVVTQFVDKEGEEVAPGEKGEIVYTSLFNFAFPLIRYNIKDIGSPKNEYCSCGIQLPLMKVVEGRSNDLLVFPENIIVSPMRFIEVLGAFNLVQEIEQYKVIQEKTDKVRIIIKKTTDDIDETKIRNILINNLIKGFPNIISSNNDQSIFRIDFVNSISRTIRGKLNVVSSQVTRKI